MKLLQINTVVNSGSTGRITEDIGLAAMAAGDISYIAAGHTHTPSRSEVISIGSDFDRKLHGLYTRITDRHGFASVNATKKLIAQIESVNPDVIGLHNLHGYYLNVAVLFKYLKIADKPVVWTFHDCWPFTGHCTHFENIGCEKWKIQCNNCPKIKAYPGSWGVDNSKENFLEKKTLFTGLKKMHIVTPSYWLADMVSSSFLKNYNTHVIHNGIDLNIFKAGKENSVKDKLGLTGKQIILGVANAWQVSKGLNDIISLSNLLGDDQVIILVGLTVQQIKRLPNKIIGLPKTKSIQELVNVYSAAEVFINPTYSDNFPTTNIEALACGTPVITYNTGGSPEAIDKATGFVIEKGDINGLTTAVQTIKERGKEAWSSECRTRAVQYFNKEDRYKDYLDLYQSIAGN